ncbi:MAG: T9SS type A sorting domain-containing protein [Bacteroidia bacterium]|jgi:hypothetical protein|nr:T9SS type A sorting domain-containing protein [Bacteroidia bacterium]
MSIITYHKAFSIQLRHEYFADEFAVNNMLKLEPTASCEDLLGRGRMVFRNTGKGGLVMYRSTNATPGTPSVELKGKQIFNFKLKLNAVTEFMNITHLDLGAGTYTPGKPVFLKATVTSSPVIPVPLTVEFLDGYRSPRFSESVQVTGGSNTLEVFDITGTIVQAQTITSGIAATRQAVIDLSAMQPGYYEVRFTDSTSAVTSRRYYVGDNIQPGEVLAMISLCYQLGTSAPLYAANAMFDYEFLAKEVMWRYYIIPRFIESGYYSAVMGPFLKTNFVQGTIPIPEFQPITNYQPTPGILIGGLNPIVFESTNPVPLREEHYFNVTLHNDKVENVLVNSLPQPDHSLPSSNPTMKEIYFYIDRLMIPPQ